MKLLATITDKDITGSDALSTAEPRIAVNTVLFDNDNNIALQYLGRYNLHTIPGGGVDPGEDLITAAKRETLEETGYNCEIIGEVGTIYESRAELDFTQKRYYYTARAIGEQSELQLTEQEIYEEATIRWYPMEKALQVISENNPQTTQQKFIKKRDIIVLTEVVRLSPKLKPPEVT